MRNDPKYPSTVVGRSPGSPCTVESHRQVRDLGEEKVETEYEVPTQDLREEERANKWTTKPPEHFGAPTFMTGLSFLNVLH